MTRWVRPNPACEHNGGLMMWVRLMGGYHWQHCPLAGHRTLGTKYQLVTEGVEGAGWLGRSIGHLPLPVDTCGGEDAHTLKSAHTRINTCSTDTYRAHTYTLLGKESCAYRLDVCLWNLVSCGLHDSKLAQWNRLSVCVSVCFLWSHNTMMQQLHTRRHWHSCMGWMDADAR